MLGNVSVLNFCRSLAELGAPGGGSAAALSGLIGAKLAQLAVNLSLSDDKLGNYTGELLAARDSLISLAAQLEALVDKDAHVLSALLGVMNENGQSKETAIVQQHLLAAAEVPLEIAAACYEVMTVYTGLTVITSNIVAADLGAGAYSCYAGANGSLLIVNANLPLLTDKKLSAELGSRMTRLKCECEELFNEIQVYIS